MSTDKPRPKGSYSDRGKHTQRIAMRAWRWKRRLDREPADAVNPRVLEKYQHATKALIDSIQAWLYKICRSWSRHLDKNYEFADLYGMAVCCVLHDLPRYDPKSGVSFCGFVFTGIKHEMMRFLWVEQTHLSIPNDHHREVYRARQRGIVNDDDLPVRLRLSQRARKVMNLGDFNLQADRHATPLQLAMAADAREFNVQRVRKAMRYLPDRERNLITLRFGLDGGECHSLGQLGEMIGVSKERVRQLTERGMNRIAIAIGSVDPDDFSD